MIDEALENPAFWILAGGGVAAELIGYIYGGRMGLPSFPWWQLIILIVGTIVASAVIVGRE